MRTLINTTLINTPSTNSRFLKAVFPAAAWALLALIPAAFAQAGRVELSPATRLEQGMAVLAGQPVSVRVAGPLGGAGTTGLLTANHGGREVWQLPLKKEGGSWTAHFRLPQPGPHVLTVRLYEGPAVWAAALDLGVLEPGGGTRPVGTASEGLDFSRSSGKPGGDVNGWWGIAAMLAIFSIIWFGTQSRGRKRA